MFYGYYKSADNLDQANFVTVGQDSLLFPPQVTYKDTPCRFIRAYQVDTPAQQKQFEEFCKQQGCDREISLTN